MKTQSQPTAQQQPEVAAPVAPVTADVTAQQTAPVAARSPLTITFRKPTWQPTKDGKAKRMADGEIVGLFAAVHPSLSGVTFGGFTVAQQPGERTMIVYWPPESKSFSARPSIRGRMREIPDPENGGVVLVPDAKADRGVKKLEDAIVDAYAEAFANGANGYDRPMPFTFEQ